MTCTHCGHTTDVPGGRAPAASSGGGSGSARSTSDAPAIVVVNSSPQASRPIIVVAGRNYRTHFSLFGFLLTLGLFYGVYYYSMRVRNNVAATVNAAERASEHGAGGEHEHKRK